MDDSQLRLALGIGPLCDGCQLRSLCGAAELDEACRPDWGEPMRGGVNVLHPHDPVTWRYLHEVGGAGFDDIVARQQADVDLPYFAHRITPRRALRGQLDDPVYLMGPEAIVRRRTLTRQQLAELTGLAAHQRVGLILFGKDKALEHLWGNRFVLIPEIAKAGYDFCVPPSYSNYSDRPRPEYLFNIKRSFEFFQLLQVHGIATIPRVAWLIDHDARRLAQWVRSNPAVECVALDSADSTPIGWTREMELLGMFDGLTGRRLRYLVHGPSTPARYLDLYELVGLDRVHLTNARGMARPPLHDGATYRDRLALERQQVDIARRLFASSSSSDVTRAA